jgi:carbon monoxide dehydrogenase subunit G
MVSFEFHVEIARHADDVFAYLSDPSRLHEWDPRVVEVTIEGPATEVMAGTLLHETRRLFGRKVTQLVEITGYEPPVLLALCVIEGPLPIDGRNVLEPIGAITRLHFTARGELTGVARRAEPLIARMLERELRRNYERLRERLEAGS